VLGSSHALILHVPPRSADVLLASSTVRECITVAALLKLPRTLPYNEKIARVDAILRELVRRGMHRKPRLPFMGCLQTFIISCMWCSTLYSNLYASQAVHALCLLEHHASHACALLMHLLKHLLMHLLFCSLSPLLFRSWRGASTR
jgi:hypothetical protein